MNFYGKMTEFFIKNKKLTLLILIGIFLWGSISFYLMPKQYNPDIVAPAFMISVDFPNATVDEVYHLVTRPLEDVINEIPGVENIYSKSIQGGKSAVIAEFYVGEDLEKSMIILRQKISSRMNLAPLGISEPFVTSIDPEDLPIKTLALSSNKIDAIGLRKIAFQLREELKLISGTSIVEVVGGRKREIQIIPNPQKMEETKTTLNEIESVLNRSSLLKDLGLIKTENKYFRIETREQANTAEEIGNIVITSNFEQFLKIKDVANILVSEEEPKEFVGFYKKGLDSGNTVFLSVSKLKGKNIVDVSKSIDRKVQELKKQKSYLENIEIEVVQDEGRVAKEEINNLTGNLIQAICVVFVVLLFFLNVRAATIVAFSIPITLLTVLAIGNLFGYTINRITLFALILSLGLLVDNATVVIENVVRNKKEYPRLGKGEIIFKSVSEVGMGLLMSTLTTVLAFIPMVYVTGMMGPYMGPIPFFVSTALIVSLFYSYSLNPWLAFFFCHDSIESDVSKKCGFICQLIKFSLDKYKAILTKLLNDRKRRINFLRFCIILLLILLTFPFFQLLKFRMLPKANREQFFIFVDLDNGVSLEKSKAIGEEISDILKSEREVKSIQSFIGRGPVLDFNGLFRGVSERSGTNQISLKVNLTHPKDRKISSEDLAFNYRNILEEYLRRYPDARLQVVEDPPGPPVRATFFVKVKSYNEELLYKTAKDLESKIKGIKGVKDVDNSALEKNDKFIVYVDKEAAARAKVSVDSISRELDTIFAGKVIGVFHSDYNLEQEYIVLKLSRQLRDNIDDLDKVNVSNELGNHVPVSRFIKVEKIDEEDIKRNDNREKVVYISGEMGRRSVTYAAIDLLGILSRYKILGEESRLVNFSLLGCEYLVNGEDKVKIEISGEWELTVKVFRDLGMAMLVAVIMIYLVLVGQFKSFVVPALIMGTIPLAMIGIIPGFAILFLLMRVYFSATSMIGVIALAGIVVNNAIIFIEYVMQVARTKNSLSECLVEAGKTRLLPIMLTSATTILGSLVIAFDPVWSGLAWSIVFGLSLSTGLTLVVFPCLMVEFLGDKWFKAVKKGDM